MFVAIYDPLPIHCIFIKYVRIVIFLVNRITNLKIILREFVEEVDDECSLRFILLEHAKNEFLEIIRISNLKWLGILIKYLVHQTFNTIVIKWQLKCCHVVHHNAKTENVRSMIIRLLLNNLWTQIKRCANLLRPQVPFLIDHGTFAQVSEFHLPVFGYQNI